MYASLFFLFSFLFMEHANIGYVKIVNCYSHEPSIGLRKISKRKTSMEVPIASRAVPATLTMHALKVTRRRKRSNGLARWAMCRWPASQLYQVMFGINQLTISNGTLIFVFVLFCFFVCLNQMTQYKQTNCIIILARNQFDIEIKHMKILNMFFLNLLLEKKK